MTTMQRSSFDYLQVQVCHDLVTISVLTPLTLMVIAFRHCTISLRRWKSYVIRDLYIIKVQCVTKGLHSCALYELTNSRWKGPLSQMMTSYFSDRYTSNKT